jgi:glutamyl-tRNA reductase
VPARELGAVLARLHAVPGIDEVVVLSTCNRVEVYAAVSEAAGRVTGPVVRAVAGLVGGRPLRAADVSAALADADLLVTATGAAVPVVAAGPVQAARAQAGRMSARAGPGRLDRPAVARAVRPTDRRGHGGHARR